MIRKFRPVLSNGQPVTKSYLSRYVAACERLDNAEPEKADGGFTVTPTYRGSDIEYCDLRHA
jgi:hypothetical protein